MVGELRVERKSDRTEGNKEKRRFRLDLPLLRCLLLSPINSVCSARNEKGGSPIDRAYSAQTHKVLHLAERYLFVLV